MKCIFSAESRCLHVWICDRRLKTEICKTLEKLRFQPRRKLMNITSNFHVTIANLTKLSTWNYRLSSPHGNTSRQKSVKLTSLGKYTAREKDYYAGFDCTVKDVNKLSNMRNDKDWSRMSKTGQKGSELVRNYQDRSGLIRTGQKLSGLVRNDQDWSGMIWTCLEWSHLVRNDQDW